MSTLKTSGIVILIGSILLKRACFDLSRPFEGRDNHALG
jgi:hypothetical protein